MCKLHGNVRERCPPRRQTSGRARARVDGLVLSREAFLLAINRRRYSPKGTMYTLAWWSFNKKGVTSDQRKRIRETCINFVPTTSPHPTTLYDNTCKQRRANTHRIANKCYRPCRAYTKERRSGARAASTHVHQHSGTSRRDCSHGVCSWVRNPACRRAPRQLQPKYRRTQPHL
jgi:hypothetical protein